MNETRRETQAGCSLVSSNARIVASQYACPCGQPLARGPATFSTRTECCSMNRVICIAALDSATDTRQAGCCDNFFSQPLQCEAVGARGRIPPLYLQDGCTRQPRLGIPGVGAQKRVQVEQRAAEIMDTLAQGGAQELNFPRRSLQVPPRGSKPPARSLHNADLH